MEMKKVTKNEFEKVQETLASEYWKKVFAIPNNIAKDELNSLKNKYYKEFEKELEKYEVLDFEVNSKCEELCQFINRNFDSEEKRESSVLYRGKGTSSLLYNFLNKYNKEIIHYDAYGLCIYSEDLLCMLTYCEGDITAEVYDSTEDLKKGVEDAKKFYKENY